MHIIGLTGGIGTGKSTVAGVLAELGAVVIDADKVGHDVLKPNSPIWQQLVREFGNEILKPDGEIDRQTLARISFSKPGNQRRLNEITHPAIYDKVQGVLEDCRRRSVTLVVIEAPLLIEADWIRLVDEVWVTTAPREVVLRRLKDRSGMSERESLARINAQIAEQGRISHANVVIDTSCGLDDLKGKVRKLLEEFKSRNLS